MEVEEREVEEREVEEREVEEDPPYLESNSESQAGGDLVAALDTFSLRSWGLCLVRLEVLVSLD